MTDQIVPDDSPPETPQQIILSLEDWTEIEDSVGQASGLRLQALGPEGEKPSGFETAASSLQPKASPVEVCSAYSLPSPVELPVPAWKPFPGGRLRQVRVRYGKGPVNVQQGTRITLPVDAWCRTNSKR